MAKFSADILPGQVFKENLHQARHTIVVDVCLVYPEVPIGQLRPLRGLPEVEVCPDNLVGQHVLHVASQQAIVFSLWSVVCGL